MMNIDFNLGDRRAKPIPLDGDDRTKVVAGACLTRQKRYAAPIAVCRRDMGVETFQREAARAATLTARAARRRRLARFAKEISQ